MTITVNPSTSTALQCAPDIAFMKRRFYPAALVMDFYQKQDSSGQMSCEERLAQANTAYHNLITGGGVQYIHHDGQTLHYTPANRDDLLRYIKTLDAQCGAAVNDHVIGCGCGCCGGIPRSKGRAMGISG